MFKKSLSVVLFITVAASVLQATALAGVMPVADRATVSVSTPTTQVEQRASPQHHGYVGWPCYGLGAVYGSEAPSVNYGALSKSLPYPYECPYYTTPYHGNSIYR